MTILEAIEAANEEAGIRTLSFAEQQEFNSFLDQFTFEEFPINLVDKINLGGNLRQSQRAVPSVIRLSGALLTRINRDTNDWRSREIEIDYLQPMRALNLKFLVSLASSDIVDPETEQIPYTITSVLPGLFHAHLCGTFWTINLPIISRVC